MSKITDFTPMLQKILTEMCKRVGADPTIIDFQKDHWFWDYTWTEKQQKEFHTWMSDYLWKNKKEIDHLASFPSLTKRSQKAVDELVDEFISNYGWKCTYK